MTEDKTKEDAAAMRKALEIYAYKFNWSMNEIDKKSLFRTENGTSACVFDMDDYSEYEHGFDIAQEALDNTSAGKEMVAKHHETVVKLCKSVQELKKENAKLKDNNTPTIEQIKTMNEIVKAAAKKNLVPTGIGMSPEDGLCIAWADGSTYSDVEICDGEDGIEIIFSCRVVGDDPDMWLCTNTEKDLNAAIDRIFILQCENVETDNE